MCMFSSYSSYMLLPLLKCSFSWLKLETPGERCAKGLTLIQGLRQHLLVSHPPQFFPCECVSGFTLRMFALRVAKRQEAVKLWWGGEPGCLCRQRWMALWEGSAQWRAGLLFIQPQSAHESERGWGTTEAEAVCAVSKCVWEGGMLETVQWLLSTCKVSHRCTFLGVIWGSSLHSLRGSYSVWVREIWNVGRGNSFHTA